MLDPDHQMRPLVEAVLLATGRKIHLSTAMRWAQQQKFRSWKIGGRRYTTVASIKCMLTEANAKSTRQIRQQQAIRRAEKELDID